MKEFIQFNWNSYRYGNKQTKRWSGTAKMSGWFAHFSEIYRNLVFPLIINNNSKKWNSQGLYKFSTDKKRISENSDTIFYGEQHTNKPTNKSSCI